MILGIGTDITQIARIARMYERYGRTFLDRVFTPEEIRYCLTMADPAPNLAARWAAKEAFYKAMPASCRSLGTWRGVGVVKDADGAPQFHVLDEKLKSALDAAGVGRIHLSLSHEKDQAIAFVIME